MVANFYDLTTSPMVGQSGPLILNNDLQPVWFQPVPKNVVASNLTSQTYKGQPVLTWWQGVVSDTGATESGEDVIVNQHYQTVATIKGVDGWVITLHELVIRGGDAWVTANKDIPMNLSKYGGTVDGVLDDSAVQEVRHRYREVALHLGPLSPTSRSTGLACSAAGKWLPMGRLPRQFHQFQLGQRFPRLDAQHMGGVHGPGKNGSYPMGVGGQGL